jgi:Protein of unknown function (DUF1638)
MAAAANTLVIACGALAREIIALRQANGWSHMEVTCLPAELHNRPEKIPALVREKIQRFRPAYPHLFVAYADCGTGGLLDVVLREEGVERLSGAHCYEFYAGEAAFAQMAQAELGTFYLTDFLLRHFERLIMHGLGIDKHPQLLPLYFGNYTTLMYLCQKESPEGIAQGQRAAQRLGLAFVYRVTGYGALQTELTNHSEKVIQWQN